MCREEGEGEEEVRRLHADSPLSVDSISGIYLGFSEKPKAEGREEEEVHLLEEHQVQEDLRVEELDPLQPPPPASGSFFFFFTKRF